MLLQEPHVTSGRFMLQLSDWLVVLQQRNFFTCLAESMCTFLNSCIHANTVRTEQTEGGGGRAPGGGSGAYVF